MIIQALAFYLFAAVTVAAGVMVVVYVGAVAVLFLFVVMMLDINFVRLREGFLQYLPLGALIGLILLVELILVLGTWALAPEDLAAVERPVPPAVSNTEALGDLFYTDYFYLFQ